MATLSSSSSSSSSNNFDLTMPKEPSMGLNAISTRRVRVVAKVRGFSDQDAGFRKGVSSISVNKPNGVDSESVTVSFGGDESASRKDSFEVGYCYEQSEGNDLIFSREVKPLISGVFDGTNATVFAYGARNTGKTSVIQGTCEKPGLAGLAMAEILSAAEQNGKSVSISFYEVYQDRVCDLLNPKQSAVLVLEDKQGKVQLKGLSRVPVRAISDFEKLYVGTSSNKPPQKTTTEPRNSHKGLVVYISSVDNSLGAGKMNFVDLAAYEDVRKKKTDGLNLSEQSKTNTSVYAFLNVINSLSANISHVPYRESKLARILQDSLGGFSKVVMITCLIPACQDSVYMIKLASRSCQKIGSVALDPRKKSLSMIRPKAVVSAIKSYTPKTVCATTKKQAVSRLRIPLSEKKVNGYVPFAARGRKLFEEKSKSKASEKKASIQTASSVVVDSDSVVMPSSAEEVNSVVKPSSDEEVNSEENVTTVTLSSGQENVLPCVPIPNETEPGFTEEKDNLSSDSEQIQFTFAPTKDLTEVGEDEQEAITPGFDINTKLASVSLPQEGRDVENELNSTAPISARLRALSNNLKALCATTVPFSMEATEMNEPKTPMTSHGVLKSDYKIANTPWETLSARSTGIKSSIVNEYLQFLNTADKEELKRLRGIGEKRATWILEFRQESPEPFKSVGDLRNIGMAEKQVKDMMRMDGPLFY